MSNGTLTLLRSRSLQVRLWWTAMLVLVALGGAGLAVAADRAQTQTQRPELTWHADHAARTWISQIADNLDAVDADVGRLSDQGRQALSTLQELQSGTLDAALSAGDAIVVEIGSTSGATASLRDDALRAIDEWRLGPATAANLGDVDAAATRAVTVGGLWADLATNGRRISLLIDALLTHDGLVFRATTAADQLDWASALDLCRRAVAVAQDAATVRDDLAARGEVAKLDDVLRRDGAYDQALLGLYGHLAGGGASSGARFDELTSAVQRARQDLPADNASLTSAVAEAGAPSITTALVALEEVRGEIRAAVDAARALTATP